MRVMDPWDFADALMAANPDVSGAVLKSMVGGGEKQVNLAHKIPVHVTYFTAWVDETGTLQVRDDVYGHDKRTEKALGL
jgi:murein L,D-transpeptidase YcbB/YkuD